MQCFVMLSALKEAGKRYEITRPRADLCVSVEKIERTGGTDSKNCRLLCKWRKYRRDMLGRDFPFSENII
jgi:hypothetical protein